MTDLILEHGSLPYPRIMMDADEITLFKDVNKSPFFGIDSNGDYQIKNRFFLDKEVQDVYRYDLIRVNKKWKLVYPNSRKLAFSGESCLGCHSNYKDEAISPDKNNIIVILESPHKDEYCKDCFKPLVPANGDTGTNFCDYFTSHFLNYFIKEFGTIESRLSKNNTYSICFVNPVPFQTSLHFIHKSKKMHVPLRDKVWKELFKLQKDEFLNKMGSYSNNQPIIILNACTGGAQVNGTLKNILRQEINIAISSKKIKCHAKFNTSHPSSWWSSKNRRCTKW